MLNRMRHEDSFAYSNFFNYYCEEPDFSGMTSCLKIQGDKVIGVCVDKVKLFYMKQAKLPGFKVIDNIGDADVYEMDLLNPLSESEIDEIKEKVSGLNNRLFRFSQDDFNYVLDSFGANTANAIQKTFDKYKKCYLDITEDQFLKDSKGNIYCVDALMDIDLYEEIQNS